MKQTGHIDIDGFKFRYVTEGEGPDVLVIGSSVYYPRSFSQNLRKSLRLHFVDYRGFAEGPEVELTFDTLLDDLEHMRQKLSLKKCIVIGHSAHGLLALEYAKMKLMPDEKLNPPPREEWFLPMNFRNVPKSWYDYNFRFAREIDVSQRLESFDRPILLAYGRFEFLVAPVHSWDSLRNKFKNLTVRIFEKSAHSPQYEEANLFDAELLKWLEET